jgi:hypothetical protein
MGFLKSFGFAELSQLTQNIPRPIGLLWLLSAVLFLAITVLFIMNKKWWVQALFAIFISQFLIMLSWHDAKFGTIFNIVILLVAILALAEWKFKMQTNNEISQLFLKGNIDKNTVITEQMLNPFPTPIQQWLKNIGIVGKENIHSVYFKQKGLMNLKPSQTKWFNAEAEQYVTTAKPAFLWKVKMKMAPFITVAGRDLFMDGKGQMLIKIASLFTVVNVSGNKKVDQSTLQRYLLELPLYPTAALCSYITWENIDEFSSKATMSYNGVSGSAIFSFNRNGDLEKISAFRFKESDENAELIECIGEIKKNMIVNGIKIPTKIDISWMLEEGKFTWYTLEIFNVKFNETKIY